MPIWCTLWLYLAALKPFIGMVKRENIIVDGVAANSISKNLRRQLALSSYYSVCAFFKLYFAVLKERKRKNEEKTSAYI